MFSTSEREIMRVANGSRQMFLGGNKALAVLIIGISISYVGSICVQVVQNGPHYGE